MDDNNIDSCGRWQVGEGCVLGANEAALSPVVYKQGGKAAITMATQGERWVVTGKVG